MREWEKEREKDGGRKREEDGGWKMEEESEKEESSQKGMHAQT